MNSILRFFVAHRTAANLLMAAMIVSGLFAATQIRAQFFPDIVADTVDVRVVWPGAGPEDVDSRIIDALEPGLLAVDGVENIVSTAQGNYGNGGDGAARITIEFEPGVDLTEAVEDVKTVVDGANALPDGIDDPVIERGWFRDRVTDVVISGPASVERLEVYAEEIRSALFRVGISRVEVLGESDPRLLIEPDPAALERYGLTLQDLADAIGREASGRPVGDLEDGAWRVRTGADRRSAEQLRDIIVLTTPNGAKLRLSDVSEIRYDAVANAAQFFRDGEPALSLRVRRDAAGDAIRIQDEVERIVAEIAPTFPDGVEATLFLTRSQYIKERLDVLLDNAAWGLAIVLALLFLFLSARTAFWVAAGIPASLLATVALMHLTGISLNVISLFALIIALGIVVDDAIVVGEHADALGRKGMAPHRAAEKAARRMAAPVLSASITTIIAFAALTLISGRFGAFIIDMPLTLIAVLTASLVEAFIILPAHMRHAIAGQVKRSWIDRPSEWVNRGFDWCRERMVRPALRLALRLRYVVLLGLVGLFATSLSLLYDRSVGWRFFVAPERTTITANIAMRAEATRDHSFEMVQELRRAALAVDARMREEHGAPAVVGVLEIVGRSAGRGISGSDTMDRDRLGGVWVEMTDPDLRPFPQSDFVNAWRDEIDDHPMLETLSLRRERSGPAGEAIDVQLYGASDARSLKAASEALQAAMASLPGVSALEDSMPYDAPELVLKVTPFGEALGYTTQSVAAEIRARLEGVVAGRFVQAGREVEIVVRLPEDAQGLAFLERTFLPPPATAPAAASEAATARGVPLLDVVEIAEQRGFASIRRVDGRRVVSVTGELADDATLRADAEAAIEARILPEIAGRYGVDYAIGGLKEQERRFLADAQYGAWLCLAGIYAVLAWVFASWTRPLVVMLVIPFGFIGAIWGHYWMDLSLSMFSVVGLLGLSGIIINDAIVLVTRIDELDSRRAAFEAALQASLDRLRAVLLTTLTTVGGLTPLLFEKSQQAQFLQPTVVTLVFGLGFGMALVLVATPALVLAQRDVQLRLRSARRLASLTVRRRPALGRPRRAATTEA